MRSLLVTGCLLLACWNAGCVVEQPATGDLQKTVNASWQAYRQSLADAHADQARFLQSDAATQLTATEDQARIRALTAAARASAFAPLAEVVDQRIGGSSYSREKSARLNTDLSRAFRSIK